MRAARHAGRVQGRAAGLGLQPGADHCVLGPGECAGLPACRPHAEGLVRALRCARLESVPGGEAGHCVVGLVLGPCTFCDEMTGCLFSLAACLCLQVCIGRCSECAGCRHGALQQGHAAKARVLCHIGCLIGAGFIWLEACRGMCYLQGRSAAAAHGKASDGVLAARPGVATRTTLSSTSVSVSVPYSAAPRAHVVA